MHERSGRAPAPNRATRLDAGRTSGAKSGAAGRNLLDLQASAGNRAVAALVAIGQGHAVQRDEPDDAMQPDVAPDSGPSAAVVGQLIDACVALAEDGRTLLLPDDVRATLEARAGDPELAATFDASAVAIDQESAESGPIAPLNQAAGEVVRELERRFILNPKASTIDLLGPKKARYYRKFAWHEFDFPGGKNRKGPHEGTAKILINDLSKLRPERRANSTRDAVIVEKEVDRDLEKTIRKQFVRIEGQPGHQLHRDAAAAFIRMREAAAAEGITLRIVDADRKFEHSRARAAKAENPAAIADFSTHNLGLAVDLKMSFKRHPFRETGTTPYGKVVEMHQSPAHKWMFLRGADFGWYPFRNEPWHWEYNPAGFRATFRESIGLEGGEEPTDSEDGGPPAGADVAEVEDGEGAEEPVG